MGPEAPVDLRQFTCFEDALNPTLARFPADFDVRIALLTASSKGKLPS